MLDFLFHWPPRMLFGVDSHKKIGEEMQGVSSKALIVCAKGPFRENGLYDDVKNSLERAGIQTYGMGDIDQNPRLSSVREGVAICKKETIDTVVAIGGGSAMDCTKLRQLRGMTAIRMSLCGGRDHRSPNLSGRS